MTTRGTPPAFANCFARMATRVEFEVEGAKGLRRIKADAIDVLILDLDMPNMSGIDVLQALGADTNGLKTIVVSGESHVEKITPILRLGAYDYLPKPYEPEQLLASVRNAVTRTRLERENRAMLDEKEATNRRDAFLINASPDLIYMLDVSRPLHVSEREASRRVRLRSGCAASVATGLRSSRPTCANSCGIIIDERRTGQRATQHFEFEYRDPRGAQHIIELSAMGLYDGTRPKSDEFVGTYGILRDVTESRRTARALAQSQQKFHALFMNSPDAVFISRLSDGHLIEANDNFARMMEELGSRTEQDRPVGVGRSRAARAVRRRTDAFAAAAPDDARAGVPRLAPLPSRSPAARSTSTTKPCLIASVKDVTAAEAVGTGPAESGNAAAAGEQDGSHRPAGRRHRARLQQHPGQHHRLHGAVAGVAGRHGSDPGARLSARSRSPPANARAI